MIHSITNIHLQSKILFDRSHMQITIHSFLSWSNSWQFDIASHKTKIMTLNSIDILIYYIYIDIYIYRYL